MKKTHWLRNTLIVLIVCGLAGTVFAAISFTKNSDRTYAYASIQFSFNGSAEGNAPNGYPFDVRGFTTDAVLESALEASGLSDKYTADQLRENLTVTGVYPDGVVSQMTKYVSLLDKNADNLAKLTDFRATQYSVRLYKDFDPQIDSGKLKELLGNIMTAYREYFIRIYAANITKTELIENLSEYDYAQQIDAITESIDQMSRYAGELAAMAPEFKIGRNGFSDIGAQYQGLKSDVDRLDATITFYAVSKDQERLQKRYEMEIRKQNYRLESQTERLKRIEEQMNAYDKDGIIYISANGELTEVGSDKDTYDALVKIRKNISDTIARINAKIAQYQMRLDDMTGTEMNNPDTEEADVAEAEVLTEAEKKQLQATVEKKLEELTAKKDAITADFAEMLEAYTKQEINEKTITVSAVRSKEPSLLSGEFIMKVIKTAGPLCAAGFMACLVGLIISRKKEEKAWA